MPGIKFGNLLSSDILEYEPILFPWLKTSINKLYDSFKGKGIVITTGNHHFNLAFLLVKTLREVLKCELPIEISFANDQDLALEKRNLIEKFKNVKCIDLSELLLTNKLQGVGMGIQMILYIKFLKVVGGGRCIRFCSLPFHRSFLWMLMCCFW